MLRPTVLTTPLLAALTVSIVMLAGACGSDEASTGAEPQPADAASDDSQQASDDVAPSGDATATLTMTDGTVYEFALTTCDTSATLPDALPLTNGYDIFGATSDGSTTLYLGRGGFSDDDAVRSGSIESGFDDEGKNASVLYSADGETLDQLVVDGPTLSGQVDFRAIGPAGPHGEETSAKVDISC